MHLIIKSCGVALPPLSFQLWAWPCSLYPAPFQKMINWCLRCSISRIQQRWDQKGAQSRQMVCHLSTSMGAAVRNKWLQLLSEAFRLLWSKSHSHNSRSLASKQDLTHIFPKEKGQFATATNKKIKTGVRHCPPYLGGLTCSSAGGWSL